MQSSNLLLLLILCIATTTTIIYAQQQQQQQTLTPKARGLTIKEITKLIETETSEEFGWTEQSTEEEEIATILWEEANKFEWSKAYTAEINEQQKYPYLLCHVGMQDGTEDDVEGEGNESGTEGNKGGRPMSGYQRLLAIEKALEDSRSGSVGEEEDDNGEEDGDITIDYVLEDENSTLDTSDQQQQTSQQQEEEDKVYLRPLYNKPDYLCVFGQLYASTAASITGEDFIIQPILPSLKYMKGSVTNMQNDINFHINEMMNGDGEGENKKVHPELDIVLCPGVAIANSSDDTTASSSIVEGGEWEEIPEDISQQIIDTLLPPKEEETSIESKLSTAMSEEFYLTSTMHTNTTYEMNTTLSKRAQLWKDLITNYQSNGKCNETYSKRLKFTISKSTQPETTSSLMNVAFNITITGNSDFDIGCMLTLSIAITSHPNVCSFEVKSRVNTYNQVITWLTQSEVENVRPFTDLELNGNGQTVSVSDTGCDLDSCYFVDDKPGFPSSQFIDQSARKVVQYVDFADKTDCEYGHGTHVAGTIAGKRIDKEGMADGIATGAKIAFGDIGDSSCSGSLSLPLDSQLLNVGRPDAKIHSMSWGSAGLNFYTTQARNFDQYMYDHDEFLIVVAAGNSGHGDTPNTVGSPATAKNVIAVGAHHNTDVSRPRGGLGPNYVADFSSRGPTSDGRTKPDIMAPGKSVLSAGARPDMIGECDPDKPPGYLDKSEGVLSLQGTSMSTPVIAGTAAIIRQYFEEGYYPYGVKNDTVGILVENPSGALIKAVLMNGAQYLAGVDNGGDGVTEIKPYDNNQNFGRLSLQDSVYLPGRTSVQLTAFDRQVVNDQKSQDYTITINKEDGCDYDKLAVTLVWVEPGSNPGCVSCLLNDLDLEVEFRNKTYYPNGRNGPDRDNNAERVIIEGVKDGDVATITVTGHNLMQNYQHYALVATGCFGGVSNQNFLDQCSAFECDNSLLTRRAIILMAVCIPLAVILCCCAVAICRRRSSKKSRGGDLTPVEVDSAVVYADETGGGEGLKEEAA